MIECYWALPPADYMKINTDGASKGNPGESGWGAIYRDEYNSVHGVYGGGLGIDTSYVAESTAIIESLHLAAEKDREIYGLNRIQNLLSMISKQNKCIGLSTKGLKRWWDDNPPFHLEIEMPMVAYCRIVNKT
ncbi:hypothetical protein ACHQM5_031228 [Ranunculus cassubicifolius]